MPNSILIVDDYPAIRERLRRLFESSGLEVCAEAVDGIDALAKAADSHPALIVLDLSMPRMNGFDAARQLQRICPGVPIILHTMYADEIRAMPALPDGVSAVVGKSEKILDQVRNYIRIN
jgi:CheY-like chemotaxis protein